ncbi:MAG: hypothetical protein LBH43_14530 [Treponema sp.]|jgi:hypothetical protein|nr:hypothetical protein [Treponema sp.]
MKKTIRLLGFITLVVVIVFSFAACEGPAGPQGGKGEQGIQGPEGPEGPGNTTGEQPLLVVIKPPTKVVYSTGEPLETAGLEIAVEYYGFRSPLIPDYTLLWNGQQIGNNNIAVTAAAGVKTITITQTGRTSATFTVEVFAVPPVQVSNTAEWNAVVTAIRTGGNDKGYAVFINGDVAAAGATANTFGTVSNVTVTLTGNGKLYLNSRGNLIRLTVDQSLIIDSAGLTLEGLKAGVNGATQDNNQSVLYADGLNARLELRNGKISGNAAGASNGGGVNIGSSATFEMSGGEISGNSGSRGGGVYVNGVIFEMSGGEISGNNASSFGGGVCIFGGGTFHLETGTIYGSGEVEDLRNTCNPGAALYVFSSGDGGTAQYSTFTGGIWNSNGNFATTNNNTIRVVNGELQP